MDIYFGEIPANTKNQDIEDFVMPILEGDLLQKSGKIDHIQILVMENPQTYQKEYHGIVSISPRSAASRIEKELNQKALKGKPVTVREYFLRSLHNDKRVNTDAWNANEKRQTERRQAQLIKSDT